MPNGHYPHMINQQFLVIVDRQLRQGDPPQVRHTLDRLKGEGFDEKTARDLIACCVANEMMALMLEDRTFDHHRYIGMLKCLPELPSRSRP